MGNEIEKIPLLNKQKEEIWELWKEYCQEDTYHRARVIVEYCTDKECDISSASEYLIERLKKYVCIVSPTNSRDYVEKDFIDIYMVSKNSEYNVADYRAICDITEWMIQEDISIITELVTRDNIQQVPHNLKVKKDKLVNNQSQRPEIKVSFESILMAGNSEKTSYLMNEIKNIRDELVNNQRHRPKEIAALMIALSENGYISINNVKEVATAYFHSFGYKKNRANDLNSLITALQAHLPDRTKEIDCSAYKERTFFRN